MTLPEPRGPRAVPETGSAPWHLCADADLLAGTRAGDEACFAALFRRYHGDLLAFASSIVGEAEAGDVVQGVFVSLWELRHDVEAAPTLKAYLFRATRNRALNARRSLRRWAFRFVGLDHADAVATPPIRADAGELARAVAAACSRLPRRQREAFGLRHFHGLSYAEIAAAMGVSPRTVEVHLAKAARTLRETLPPELLRP